MVNRLVGITRGNIYIVMVVTVLVAFIGHLDGAYNTTYLIAIPALAPLYKRLNIDRRSLVLLVSLAAAPMTAMAWGQPAKMTVFDPSIDPVVMASSLYPVVAIMLGLAVVTSLGFGYYYSKKNASEIALLRKSFENGGGSQKVDFSDNPLARPKLFWANFALFLGSLACFMFMTGVKTYVLFMVFSCAALLLNYHTQKEQSQIIIMDISMPEMNGVEAAERIRSLDEDCIIIFLTAYDEFSYAKRAIVIRALDYLLKPCEEDELVAVMEEAMRLTDKRLNVSGVPSPGVPSPGVPSPGVPSPDIPSPDIRREEHAEAMPRDDGDGRLAQVAETIREYIRNNYMKEISMQDAARMMNYSDAYFCKLFKQCFDQNFTSYLTGFRVNEAKKLLKDRSISVKDVSMQVGYYDSNYFAKVFKRMTGMIPSEYRDSETAQK